MKNPAYRIGIDKPCSEKWDAMQASGRGKFCSTCSKNVIDFTKLSDSEIIRVLQHRQGNLCGRLNTTQLDRLITAPADQPAYPSFYKAIAGAVLLSGTIPMGVKAAELRYNFSTEINESGTRPEDPVKKAEPAGGIPVTLRGTVIDSGTCGPLQGCYINLQNSSLQAFTDTAGNFELTVPDVLVQDSMIITVYNAGYGSTEISVLKTAAFEKIEILLQPDEMQNILLNEIVIETQGEDPMKDINVEIGRLIILPMKEQHNSFPVEMWINHLFH